MDKAMKDALIERAAKAMCVRNGEDPDTLSRTGIMWKYYWDRATTALEATGVFDLVEAATQVVSYSTNGCFSTDWDEESAEAGQWVPLLDWDNFIAALNRMKEQSNDPA